MAKYEYNTFTSSVELTVEDIQVSPERMVENVTLHLQDMIKRFQTEKRSYGDYEILSHSSVLLGKYLVISFLLRRSL